MRTKNPDEKITMVDWDKGRGSLRRPQRIALDFHGRLREYGGMAFDRMAAGEFAAKVGCTAGLGILVMKCP